MTDHDSHPMDAPAPRPALSFRDARVQAGAVIAVLVVVLGAVYVAGTGGPAPVATAPPPADTTVAPTAENVDPTIHARMMALRAEVEAAPADTAKLLALARMEHDAHQFEAAAATYERLIALAPAHRQAHLDLAQAWAAMGRWADARAAMERMLARFPDDPSGLYNLGAILANQGDYAAARPYWARVRTQTADPELAQQAAASLERLDALAAAPPAATPPGGAPPLPPGAAGNPLPSGHPPIPAGAGRPAAVCIETSDITGPPRTAGAPLPAPPPARDR